MALEDLTHCYKVPCVADIKMGTQTFEPTASPEKKARELTKYSFQKEVGFRITGFKTHNITTGQFKSVEKAFGRSLHPSDVQDAVGTFFHNGRLLRRDVLAVVIAKLDKLLRWFNTQRQYSFFCSSILIVYEADETSGWWADHPVNAAAPVAALASGEGGGSSGSSGGAVTPQDLRDWSTKVSNACDAFDIPVYIHIRFPMPDFRFPPLTAHHAPLTTHHTPLLHHRPCIRRT